MKNIENITTVKLSDIVPDENQPRKLFDAEKLKTLIDSIKRYGIMSPMTVEKIGDKYLLVDGERRYKASKELGMKEVPVTITTPENPTERLVKQFHIQEQREGWTATERASTVNKLSKELGLSMTQIGELLSLDRSLLRRYIAFSNLADKQSFEKSEISLHWADPINTMIGTANRVYDNILEETFTSTTAKKVQNAIVSRIKNGELTRPAQLSKLRDSIKKNPKAIKEFVESSISISDLFIKSKAQAQNQLRNIVASCSFGTSTVRRFLERPDAIPNEHDIRTMKTFRAELDKLLTKITD